MDERMRSIQTDLRGLAEIQNPSDEDVIVQDSLISEYSKLEADAAPLRQRMAELDRIRQVSAEPDSREEATPVASRSVGGLTLTRSTSDPLENLDAVSKNLVASDELRSRAMSLIEEDHKRQRWEFSDDAAEAATVRAQSPQIGRHILLTGSPEYREAFRTYLESGDDARFRDIRLANASGGYMLPYVLDPTIVLTNSGSQNPFRQVARVVQTTSNAWQGVSSAGVNAALIAEAATAADGGLGAAASSSPLWTIRRTLPQAGAPQPSRRSRSGWRTRPRRRRRTPKSVNCSGSSWMRCNCWMRRTAASSS
jgi:hypothetical protein